MQTPIIIKDYKAVIEVINNNNYKHWNSLIKISVKIIYKKIKAYNVIKWDLYISK